MSTEINIVVPDVSTMSSGIRTTAERIAYMVRAQGARERISLLAGFTPSTELCIFLNAYRSRAAIESAFKARNKVIVVVTGTDLNEHLVNDCDRDQVFSHCNVIVLLHPGMLAKVPKTHQDRAIVIEQSALVETESDQSRRRSKTLISYVANIRAVKEPMTVLNAAKSILPFSRCTVLHCGAVIEAGYDTWKLASYVPGRYKWVGGVSRSVSLKIIRRSRATIIASRSEGGSNVLSEAVAYGTPILSSSNECSVALLGVNYPGLFPIRDSVALATLMVRIVADESFFHELVSAAAPLRERLNEDAEKAKWAAAFRRAL